MQKKAAAVILGILVAAAAIMLLYPRLSPNGAYQRPVERPKPAVTAPAPDLNDGKVRAGRLVYSKYCANCHGGRAQGAPDWKTQNSDKTFPPPPHDPTGHTWHHTDGLLFKIVRDGGKAMEDPGFKSAMPAYGDILSDEQIVNVITYLKSLWEAEQRASQAAASRRDPFPGLSEMR